MITAFLALLLATPPGGQLAQRFQGGFAVFAAKDKPQRVALGFKEFHGEPGRLIGYSLETGGYFFTWLAPLDHINYGRRVGTIGDLDGDGFEDLAVGCSRKEEQREAPIVELHSGRTGELVGTLEAQLDETGFGECLTALPDLDGDGKADFLVGASMKSPLKRGSFAAYVLYSGATRERIGRVITDATSGLMQGPLVLLPGPKGHPWAAHSTGRMVVRMDLGSQVVEEAYALEGEDASTQVVGIAPAGDLDGDGCEELLLALNFAGGHGWRMLDGKSWKPRELPAGAAHPDGPLAWIQRVGDLDGDGTPDFLAERSFSEAGLLYAFSGKTLACLRTIAVPEGLSPFFGGQCGWLRPDGLAPVALAASYGPLGRADKRGVYVFDWDKGTLVHALGRE